MTDNENMREQNFIDRIAVFKKRTTDFFADYENPSGSEDRLEICLIRDGCRAVSQAEEIINRKNAEIERLKRTIAGLSLYYKDLANFEKIYTDEIARYAFEKAAKYTEEMAGEG